MRYVRGIVKYKLNLDWYPNCESQVNYCHYYVEAVVINGENGSHFLTIQKGYGRCRNDIFEIQLAKRVETL